jgi:HAD superfamily hydrolase (TIGR01549 family)
MAPIPAIKAIFYDLDGTLRLSQPSGLSAFAAQTSSLGQKISPDDLSRASRWEHYYFAESPELISDRAEYSDGSRDFWAQYSLRQLQVLGVAPKEAHEWAPKISAYMDKHYQPEDIILDEVYTTLRELRARGYALGILSNRFEPYTDYLAEKGLTASFDLVVHAGEAGIRKPNPQVFDYLLARAGFSAAESLYVGDNYYADVVGARAAGLYPVLYDREQAFPNPDCSVISAHPQLLDLLEGRK